MTPETDRLVSENLGLVYDTAKKLDRSGGAGPERGDLISAGVQGLIQAANAFDPGRGLAFSTLAVTRIRGSMLDEMRRWDITPRSVRKKERQIKACESELRALLQRQPTVREMADALEISVEDVHAWHLDMTRHVEDSLDETPSGRNDEGGRATVVEMISDGSPDASETLGREEAVQILGACITLLPEREARVLALYYFEELRLREIAELMGVTESRISQIRHGALNKLRVLLEEKGVDR
jgi:RNA polymerase sigma factor FliA